MPRTPRRWSFLKKSPRHLGDDPGGPPEGHSDRTVVAGRGPGRPEEHDRAPLGPTGHPAPRPAGSADEFGLHLRSNLPATGQGRGPGAAAMRHAGHEPALGGSRTAVAPGAHGVMLMDRAGWHCAKDLVVPDNL